MSEVHLGRLAPKDAERDATHVAVAPMVAAIDLRPGEHCGIYEDGTCGPSDRNIGIVDPFLTKAVRKGEQFYLCLYPRTVTGLRHVYVHPALDNAPASTSQDWLKSYANNIGDVYESLMAGADRWVNSNNKWGEYYLGPGDEDGMHGLFEGVSLHSDFWDHYEKVRGVKVPENKRHSFFSCSC